MSKKLTKKRAKKFCILKWEYIVGNNGSAEGLLYKHSELQPLKARCAYCELYLTTNKCIGCPLNKEDISCFGFGRCLSFDHPYRIWLNNQTKENAQAVLDLIKNS